MKSHKKLDPYFDVNYLEELYDLKFDSNENINH